MGSSVSKKQYKSQGLEGDSSDLGRTETQKNSFLGGKDQKKSEAKSSLRNTGTDPTRPARPETDCNLCPAGGDYNSEIDGTKSDMVLSKTQTTVAAESESKKSVVADSMSETDDDETVLDTQSSVVFSGTVAVENEGNNLAEADANSETDYDYSVVDSESIIDLLGTQAIGPAENESNNLAEADAKSKTDDDDSVLDSESTIDLLGTQAIAASENESNNLAEAEESNDHLMWLPYEVLQRIWKDLTFKDLKNMRCVSNWWRINLNVAGIFDVKMNVTTSVELRTLMAASCPIEYVMIEGKTTKIISIASDTEDFPMIREAVIGSKISAIAIKNILKCLAWSLESLTFGTSALEDGQSLTTTLDGLEWPKLKVLNLVICLEKQNVALLSKNILCFLDYTKLPVINKLTGGFILNYSFDSLLPQRSQVQRLFSGFYSFVQAHVQTLSDFSFKLISEDRNKLLTIPKFPDSLKNAFNATRKMEAFEIVTNSISVYEDATDLLMNLGFPLKKIKIFLRQNRENFRIDTKKLENIIKKHGESLEELEFDFKVGQQIIGFDLAIFQMSCPRLETLSLKMLCIRNTGQLSIPTLKNVKIQVHEAFAFQLALVNGARIQRLTLWETSRAFNSRAIYMSFPTLTYLHIQNFNGELYRYFSAGISRLFGLREFKTTFSEGFNIVHKTNIIMSLVFRRPAMETLTVFGMIIESRHLQILAGMGHFKKICFEFCKDGVKEFCRVNPRLTLKVIPKSNIQIEKSVLRNTRDIYEVWFNRQTYSKSN